MIKGIQSNEINLFSIKPSKGEELRCSSESGNLEIWVPHPNR